MRSVSERYDYLLKNEEMKQSTKTRLIMSLAFLPYALAASYWLLDLYLWSREPWGGQDVMQEQYFKNGIMKLWMLFSPILGIFLWLAIIGIGYAVLYRDRFWDTVQGILLSWPLAWAIIVLVSSFIFRSESFCLIILFVGSVLSLIVLPVSYLFNQRRIIFLPAVVNIAWLFILYWYAIKQFVVYGD